jgi:hypothetical protein
MPLLVGGGPLRGHDRQSMSLTVCLNIRNLENAKKLLEKGQEEESALLSIHKISQELQRLQTGS